MNATLRRGAKEKGENVCLRLNVPDKVVGLLGLIIAFDCPFSMRDDHPLWKRATHG